MDQTRFRRLPSQQTRSSPCCIHPQHSAGETDGCLTSAKTDRQSVRETDSWLTSVNTRVGNRVELGITFGFSRNGLSFLIWIPHFETYTADQKKKPPNTNAEEEPAGSVCTTTDSVQRRSKVCLNFNKRNDQ